MRCGDQARRHSGGMNLIRHAILAAALIAGLAPAMGQGQVPPPGQALPDTERRASYSLNASTWGVRCHAAARHPGR
jgi:hypothetical protein